jgi:8-oxo-dGTP diphosphatase
MDIKQFIATKAFISFEDKILILRESKKYADSTNTGKYDIPGGRLNPGENFMEALKREIKEETGLDIDIKEPFFVNEWNPIVREQQWQIVGIFFKCNSKSDKVILSKDHDSFIWINPKEAHKYNIIDNLRKAFEEYVRDNK